MSVELTSSSTEFLRKTAAHAVRGPAAARGWWIVALLLVIGAYALLAYLAPAPGAWWSAPWVMAPLVGVIAWAEAARRADQRTRLACRLFIGAAAAGLITQLAWASEIHVLARGGVPRAAYLLVIQYVLMAAGAWLCLGRRGRMWATGVTADALLVFLAGLVLVLRVVVEPLLISMDGGRELTVVASLQTVALVPLFFAALLVLRRSAALPPASAAALLAAALAFMAGGMLSLSRLDPEPFTPGDPFDYLWLVAWLLLGAAGFAARTLAPTARAMLRDRKAHDGLRRAIVPAAALFLALGVVDVALRPVIRPETVVAIILLGGMLALRTAHAFALTDRDQARKRQLGYTRALLDVTHTLSDAPDLDATLRVIVESARSVLGTHAAGIELIMEDGATLETRAAVGLPRHVVGLRFPVRGSFTGWVVRHGQARTTSNPTTDPYVQPQSLHFLGRSPVAAAPIRFRGETTGALYACIRNEPFDAEELSFLGAMAEQAAMAIERARLFEQVSLLSDTDPLTGLANRRSLQRELDREFAAARRGRDLVVVMFDLDGFKPYNDRHGHLAGDEALKAFARALQEETRTMNLGARYGGDEFVALLSDTRPEGARTFVERVRIRFESEVGELGRGVIHVSAGIAAFDPAMRDPDALVRAADKDLYREKARTRV